MKKVNILGVFDDEDRLVDSIHRIRSEGIRISDVVSPFPVHEVFHALGLKTRIPLAAFLYGVAALLITFGFLYWTSVMNYPLVFGGKPQNTLSFVIVIFVMVINITAALTILTFFLREKKDPGAKSDFEYPGINDDKFVIIVEQYEDLDVPGLKSLMKETGALDVSEQEIIEVEKEPY